MSKLILYVHGKNGSPSESDFYAPIFHGCHVVGLDYASQTPWEAKREFNEKLTQIRGEHTSVTLIANSIGAFLSMHAFSEKEIEEAYFISPVVDMEGLIISMMKNLGISMKMLEDKKIIPTPFGEDLSWEYLCYVKNNPIKWAVPTHILYGEKDALTPLSTMENFAKATNFSLTVMNGGEHWFHTKEQLEFLKNWLKQKTI